MEERAYLCVSAHRRGQCDHSLAPSGVLQYLKPVMCHHWRLTPHICPCSCLARLFGGHLLQYWVLPSAVPEHRCSWVATPAFHETGSQQP